MIFLQVLLLPLAAMALPLETPVPEQFLAPRDFNPHPVTDVRRPARKYKRLRIPDPVDVYAQYQEKRGDVGYYASGLDKTEAYFGQRLSSNPRIYLSHHLPLPHQQQQQQRSYPHEDLTQATFTSGGRYQQQSYDEQLYDDREQLRREPEYEHNYVQDEAVTVSHRADEHIPKQYAFSYAVLDHHSGDDFSHAQSHDGHSTEGEYRVKLPDGRVQVVRYTADKGGYRAKVSYEPAAPEHQEQGKVEAVTYDNLYQRPPPSTPDLIRYDAPKVRVEYNGDARIEPSRQIYEHHHVYKRGSLDATNSQNPKKNVF